MIRKIRSKVAALQAEVPPILRRPGWVWTPKGLKVKVGRKNVYFPLQKVLRIFDDCMARYGVGAAYRVGSCHTAVGFFKKISRGVKKAVSSVKKAVSPAIKKVTEVAKKVATPIKKVITHPAFRAGLGAAATAFPVLAPAVAGVEAANMVIGKIEAGKKMAKSIKKDLNLGKKPSKEKLGKVLEGRTAQKGVQRLAERAKGGDRKAARAMGGVVAAKTVQRTAKKAQAQRRGKKQANQIAALRKKLAAANKAKEQAQKRQQAKKAKRRGGGGGQGRGMPGRGWMPPMPNYWQQAAAPIPPQYQYGGGTPFNYDQFQRPPMRGPMGMVRRNVGGARIIPS